MEAKYYTTVIISSVTLSKKKGEYLRMNITLQFITNAVHKTVNNISDLFTWN